MKKVGAVIFFLSFFIIANAQQKFWITFTDKANVTFDPYSYFDERTIHQRLSQNIPLNDSTDYPINPDYLESISKIVNTVSLRSRWLNGVAVYADEKQIQEVVQLRFVKSAEPMTTTSLVCAYDDQPSFSLSKNDSALLFYQTRRLQGDSFAAHGFDGTGIRIAILDAGFPGVDKHPAFAHLRDGKKIIATYDFVKGKENVYKYHWHGSATLSCLAGKMNGINIGLATGSEFLLARTEKGGEFLSEEENWIAAAEWADKLGANIISSSLGYTDKRYFNNQMDGHTSLVARGATIAASKGILVVSAAGNEGSNDWHYLVTPADADSVLTVAGTDPVVDFHIPFSSFGPSSSGKLKPNVCAPGTVIAAFKGKLGNVAGTSFSTPLVAGFAACAWQSNRKRTNMELFDAIEQSSHLYPYYDYAHGFGIPQASWFVSQKLPAEPTFDFVIINSEIKIILREQFSYSDTEEALGYHTRRNFYYKIENKNGDIIKYFVLLAEKKEILRFLADDFHEGDILTIHFEGYTKSLSFPLEN